MRTALRRRSRAPLAAILLLGWSACTAAPGAGSSEASNACESAVRFRDQWLRANPSDETAILQRGEIVTVQRLGPPHYRMWQVTFVTETGDHPEGMCTYYLHVHFVVAGTDVQLLQVERGPDAIS